MLFTKVWILINSLLYFGIGCATLLRTNAVANTISYQLLTAGAIAEFKAMYGGLQIALAAIMLLLYKTNQLHYALGFIAIIYLGFGSGRLIGILSTGAHDRTTLMYFAVEISSICISGYLFFKAKL